MNWIHSEGGPLLLASAEDAAQWTGYRGDYARACSVRGYAGVLPLRVGEGLVLDDEPMATAYWATEGEPALLVRWCYAPNEEAVITAVRGLDYSAFGSERLYIDFRSSELVLFDSAIPGVQIPDEPEAAMGIQIRGTALAVATAAVKPRSDIFLVVHCLRVKR